MLINNLRLLSYFLREVQEKQFFLLFSAFEMLVNPTTACNALLRQLPFKTSIFCNMKLWWCYKTCAKEIQPGTESQLVEYWTHSLKCITTPQLWKLPLLKMEAFPGFGDDFFCAWAEGLEGTVWKEKKLQANYPVSLRTMAISPSLGVFTNTAQQSSY